MSLPMLRSETIRPADVVSRILGRPTFHSTCPGCQLPTLLLAPIRALCVECVEAKVKDTPAKGYWLYRLFGGGRLLYVGVTRTPRRRMSSHWRRWGAHIDDVTWEECADERDMLRREAEAIRTEHPAFNVLHPEI